MAKRDTWLSFLDEPAPSPFIDRLSGIGRISDKDSGANDWVSYFMSGGNQPQAEGPSRFFNRIGELMAEAAQAKVKAAPKAPIGKAAGTPTPTPAVTAPGGTSSVPQWVSTVAPLAQQYGVPMDVALGIMDIESGGNPNAVSAAGAKGLMQVMPANFAAGEDGMDPVTNISRGLKMLADRYARFGNWDSAVASYFGAIGTDGKPSMAKDINGQSGVGYVRAFNNARTKYATP